MDRPEHPAKPRHRLVRIITYNVIVLFVLANALYWAIPANHLIYTLVQDSIQTGKDPRPSLPNYVGIPWAATHYREFEKLQTRYLSHIGWRRENFNGTTIVVEGPYLQRRTVNTAAPNGKSVFFFGGSTMWGTGVDDTGTIPSQFAAITGMHAENFGETGYTAHQNLVLLLRLLEDGLRPETVVFYDGVNDVAHKCRHELTPNSDALEFEISMALKAQKTSPFSFSHFFSPVVSLARQIKATSPVQMLAPPYDCASDNKKAEAIAENLVRDWRMAKQLVEAYGGRFIAALQPVSFLSKTKLDHLQFKGELEGQFRSVYPMMLKKLAASEGFHDLTPVVDVDAYLYVDFCHLSTPGNRRVAERIAEFVAAQ
jgi:lysophospholipase L1-like esterase